jgi:small conductance mechanosensitive channel
MVAIGATGLLLLMFGGSEAVSAAQDETGSTPTALAAEAAQDTAEAVQDDVVPLDTTAGDPAEAAREATGTLRELAVSFYNILPSIGIALALLLAAALLAWLVKHALRTVLASWERAEAISALAAIGIWLLALGAALSVVAGDARALVGSIGLFGLALSWALQTPIESFTGWLLNSFRSYYRVGDRIAVGKVFGDVARVDFLTTTVFEAGGPDKNVRAAQSTGAMVTFPNSEILRANVINYTRDFPFVFDEMVVAVANESDVPFAIEVVRRVAEEVVGERMEGAADVYAEVLERAHLGWDVARRPEVYLSATDSWLELTVRYVVPVREMRKWASRLQLALNEALAEPTVAKRVFPGYTRTQVQPLRMGPPSTPDPEPEQES